jgi:large subunit ribosomal protein L7A
MPYDQIAKARRKTVGAKQTMKAVEKERVKLLYIAKDAERHVTEPIIKICESKNIPFVKVDSMKNLGKACGIDVRCAIAAIIEE